MTSEDFQKYIMKSVITKNQGFSLSRYLGCCLTKKDLKLTVKIGLDKLAYRHSDNSINMVVEYPNDLMRFYKYLDIMLVCRYVIKKMDSKNSMFQSRTFAELPVDDITERLKNPDSNI